jgi:hypothetical protein
MVHWPQKGAHYGLRPVPGVASFCISVALASAVSLKNSPRAGPMPIGKMGQYSVSANTLPQTVHFAPVMM